MALTDTSWQVYIIRCAGGSLYTGITTDVERRFRQHADRRGARYFRGRTPEAVVYLEAGHSRASASRREAAIKRLPRHAKLQLLTSAHNQLTNENVS